MRLSNVCDHAKNDQHTHAMHLLKKKQATSAGLSPSNYSQIAQVFSRLSEEERERLRIKFNIAYFVATQNLPLSKYSRICELESHHGVCVGSSYTNDNSGKEMIHYIADSIRLERRSCLSSSCLSSQTLDDLLLIKNNEIPLSKFSPDPCIDLWWQAKIRRPAQKERKKYKPRQSESTGQSSTSGDISEPDDEVSENVLECWDNLFDSDSD